MDRINDVLGDVSSFVWGPWLLIPLLLLTGLYLTVMLRGLQFRQLGPSLYLALIKRKESGTAEGDVSHFQALTTALAATIGVGNIAGVGTAIYLGGPGALFWMWITGLLGMATKYSEAFLGVRFRRKDANGQMSGGPMYYLTDGVGGRFGRALGIFFAVAGAVAAFGIGNGTQSNTVAVAIDDQWGVPTWISGLVMTVAAAAVVLGGIQSIGRVSSAFVPVMAVLYIAGGLAVLAVNVTELPAALALIVSDAFTGTSAVGGFAGAAVLSAIRYGVARGIFSNESGLGTGGIAAAAAQSAHPTRQALVSMTQTFLDTLVVVSFTGLAVIVTGAWKAEDVAEGAPMTIAAFQSALGDWAGDLVVISIILFAFSTILGWGYYGERCMERLFGVRAIMPYRVVFVAVVMVGATTDLATVWLFSDIANGLMALPNLIGLLVLAPLVVRETREYFADPETALRKAAERSAAQPPGSR
ncbi:alanine/glycine:cation symporter family protein [Allostreptomyces psammosilenae]|uniref:AGCS family alanine or glycine:cation symporter n=1 Tax=Allostreptomyces psammosilenae TaxID=1892865 RepID=A0A853A1U5_9ACTN|nr:sodium:alanine symporter family protein [Allostreptomyces psammosilenae]NYI04398.1 AGCS family alanine or glycine:cation symporter [Allostreptomyces psammosilenae]